jgi:uncharacterized protein (DUF362 family)
MAHSAAAGLAAWQADRLWAADAPAAAAPSATGVDMTIAKWSGPAVKGATDPEIPKIATKLVEQAIEGLGGMKRFVKKGDVVWVKPNIGWDRAPELAGNTNPEVVAALIKMCLDAGAKTVKIGDNTVHAAAKSYVSSGIEAVARQLGAEVVYLDKNRYKETAVKGERLKTLMLYPDIIDCDLVINVPVVKHHVLTNATLVMKNYMGVMDNRQPFHQDFATCLTDLTRFMKPRLSVLDAVRILTAHGPSGGKPEDVAVKTTVAAGVDAVALDALGVELLGKDPAEMKKAASIIKYAAESGLGKANYRALALKEIAVA